MQGWTEKFKEGVKREREREREREANVKNFPLEKEISFGSTHRMMHPSLPFSRNNSNKKLYLICSLDHLDVKII